MSLTFRLWYPRWTTHDGRLRCRFQATTMGEALLGAGSEACMTTFLADLGAPAAPVVSWSVTRYRTPSLSDFPDSPVWEDRFALAWDVTVDTTSGADPDDAGTHAPGPHPGHATDETARDDDWEQLTDRVIVLAGRPYGPRVDGMTGTDIFDGIVALDLGVLSPMDGTDRVDAILASCASHGLPTTWK